MKEFITRLFTLDLSEYFPDLSFRINAFLLAVTVGLMAGCLLANLYSGALASLIKKMIRTEAFGEENAKTLPALKEDRPLLRSMLSADRGRVARYIRRAGAVKPTYEEYLAQERARKEAKRAAKKAGQKGSAQTAKPDERIDFASAAFYIPEERREEALRYYEKDGSSWGKALLSCLLFFAVWLILAVLMPSILALVKSVIS